MDPQSRSHLGLGLAIFAGFVVLGVAGYSLGSSLAPSEEDARKARVNSFNTTRETAQARAFERAAERGRIAGMKAGQANAETEATNRGNAAGEIRAEAQLAVIAAEAEAAERAANCGAPLFVDGYCPTDEEIEQEGLAESLCGPGDPALEAEAAEQGIQCRSALTAPRTSVKTK